MGEKREENVRNGSLVFDVISVLFMVRICYLLMKLIKIEENEISFFFSTLNIWFSHKQKDSNGIILH